MQSSGLGQSDVEELVVVVLPVVGGASDLGGCAVPLGWPVVAAGPGPAASGLDLPPQPAATKSTAASTTGAASRTGRIGGIPDHARCGHGSKQSGPLPPRGHPPDTRHAHKYADRPPRRLPTTDPSRDHGRSAQTGRRGRVEQKGRPRGCRGLAGDQRATTPWRSVAQVVAGMPNSEHWWSVVKLVSVNDVPGTSAWSCSLVASKRGQNGVTNVFGLLNQANWVQ